MGRLVVCAYVAVLAAVGAVALLTHTLLAGTARSWLEFGFPGVDDTPGAAASIFVVNLQVAVAGFAACFVVQGPRLVGGARARSGRGWRVATRVADVVVVAVVAGNVALVGLALGGYGERMARMLLPHGPVELAAFAAVLGLYLHARRAPVGGRLAATLGGGAVVTLAAAAVLETYLTPDA